MGGAARLDGRTAAAPPMGGLDEEITGVLPAVEPVASATFRLPSREDLGDFTSGRRVRYRDVQAVLDKAGWNPPSFETMRTALGRSHQGKEVSHLSHIFCSVVPRLGPYRRLAV